MVWVVKDNVAESRTVQPGPSDGQKTVVESGLQAGDMVITNGQQGLIQGEKVSVKSS